MSIVDALKSAELFVGLKTDYLERVSALCRGRSFQQGTMIFKEGDEAAELYILTSGEIVLEMELRVSVDRPAIPTAVEVVTKGQCFGWSALVEPYVYTLSARCVGNCTALAIKGDMLRAVMAEDAVLGYEVMERLTQLISRRLAETRLRLTSGLGIALMGKGLENR